MARDRQRAKQRRRRQDGGGAAARSAARARKARDVGLDDASVDDAGLGEDTPAPDTGPAGRTPTPDPLDHASADVDQAKLAERARSRPRSATPTTSTTAAMTTSTTPSAHPTRPRTSVVSADPDAHERPSRKQRGRVLTFLRHCVEELRRVQWPNRRQVGQATAVVLGFVVLAGGYLGLLDALWKPIIDAIL